MDELSLVANISIKTKVKEQAKRSYFNKSTIHILLVSFACMTHIIVLEICQV